VTAGGGEPRQDRALGVGERHGLLDGAGGSVERDEPAPLELDAHAPRRLARLGLGDPDEQQREPANQ